MLDTSSDSCEELAHWSSTPKTPKLFLTTPNNMEFKFKIKPAGGKFRKFCYTLKEGQELPYHPDIHGLLRLYVAYFYSTVPGFRVLFGQTLEPSMGEGWSGERDGDFWVFKGL